MRRRAGPKEPPLWLACEYCYPRWIPNALTESASVFWLYQPSTRPFPRKLAPPQYPTHFEVRKVSANGGIRWHSKWINVSHLLGR